MKKHLLALAALATVSGFAAAQSSVTVYGTLDMGVKSSNSKTTGNTAGTKNELASGTIAPSVIGFTGTEDLGGGLKAGFALETHLDPTDGTRADLGTSNQLFARQANLNLSGNFGKVTLGRQFSPGVLAFAATDPRGLRESASGLQMWVGTAQTDTPNNATAHYGIFVANAVSYSYAANGVSAAVLYATGEAAGSTSQGALTSAGVTYTGPVTLSAAYEKSQRNVAAATTDTVRYSVGVGYTVGALTIKANHINADHQYANTKDKTFGFGGSYQLTPVGALNAAIYTNSNTAAGRSDYDSESYVVGYEHSLSKRTTLFAQYASSKQKNGTVSASLVSGIANATATVTAVGVKHSF
jgi:predicted porin